MRTKINNNTEWESHYHNILPQSEFELFRKYNTDHPYIKRILKYAKGRKRSLEFGSGTGMVSLGLKREFPEIETHLLDFSQAAVQYSQELFKYYGVKGRFCRGSFLSLPYPDGYFDFIHGMTVLEHVKDTEKAIKELTRVLADGGVGVISVPNSFRRFEHDFYHFINNIRYYSRTFYPKELEAMFIKYSNRVVERFGNTTIFFYPTYPFQFIHRLAQIIAKKHESGDKISCDEDSVSNATSESGKVSFVRKMMRVWGHGQSKFNNFIDRYEILPYPLMITIGVVIKKE